jgi:hypothetical protein
VPTEELEHELRRAFAEAAAGYQHAELARQRLLQRNYRPGSGPRRLAAGLTAVAAAGAVVLGLGLSGALSSAPARGTGAIGSAPARGTGADHARGTGTIRTAAFTLTRNANGTDTLTINPRVLLEPSTLQYDLAQYGIRAKVTVGSFCSSDPGPAGFTQVVTFSPSAHSGRIRPPVNPTITINPAAMSAGTELSFGNFQLTTGQETAFTLIDSGSYTCTSTAPTSPMHGDVIAYNHS